MDVRRCNIDFLACSVHKWLFGPYGLSFMYASEKWCTNPRTEPIVHDEHNRVGADGDKVLPFHPTLGYAEEWMVGARRFDSGGRPNPILLPMVEMALTQILAWGQANIEVSLSLLTARVAAGSRVLGLSVPAHFAPHFVGVGPGPQDAPGGKSPVDVEARERWADAASSHLEARNIYVSSRGGSLRVAPHVYNTFDDIDKFLEALGSFVRVRRPTASL